MIIQNISRSSNQKFDNNMELRKVDFLSPKKTSERSRFVNKALIFS